MKKFVVGVIVFSLVIVALGVYLLSRAPARVALFPENEARIGLESRRYDFGSVRLNSGLIVHRYVIRNLGKIDLKIANLASSCACIKVYFKSANQESPRAGMKGMTKISEWIGVLQPEESGEVIIEFDPNFHGPQGVGKITRAVSFETNDPQNRYVELSFNGEVTK
ncbi:MAG: DUF1573 domain-containing protein [Candidatus Shapirobacteria bacterium]